MNGFTSTKILLRCKLKWWETGEKWTLAKTKGDDWISGIIHETTEGRGVNIQGDREGIGEDIDKALTSMQDIALKQGKRRWKLGVYVRKHPMRLHQTATTKSHIRMRNQSESHICWGHMGKVWLMLNITDRILMLLNEWELKMMLMETKWSGKLQK